MMSSFEHQFTYVLNGFYLNIFNLYSPGWQMSWRIFCSPSGVGHASCYLVASNPTGLPRHILHDWPTQCSTNPPIQFQQTLPVKKRLIIYTFPEKRPFAGLYISYGAVSGAQKGIAVTQAFKSPRFCPARNHVCLMWLGAGLRTSVEEWRGEYFSDRGLMEMALGYCVW